MEVRRNVVHVFLKKTRAGQVDVANYGTVVKSGWGDVSYELSLSYIIAIDSYSKLKIAISNNVLETLNILKNEMKMMFLLVFAKRMILCCLIAGP